MRTQGPIILRFPFRLHGLAFLLALVLVLLATGLGWVLGGGWR